MSRWVGWAAALAAALVFGAARGSEPPSAGMERLPRMAGPLDAACGLNGVDRARTPPDGCIACHDGAGGRAVMYLRRAGKDVRLDHPVDVPYGDAALRTPDRLAPLAQLPSSLVLVNGKISCTTCHDGASTQPGHLAGDMMTLCTSCHRM